MRSKFLLIILLISCFVFVAAPRADTVQALGTFYIRADGSVDPPTPLIQRNGDVYTLTGNINSSSSGIVIERNNTILEGNGYTLQGTGRGNGIQLTSRTNVTVQNLQIKAFDSGISFGFSSNNSISRNTIKNNFYGIALTSSSNYNSIDGNNATTNDFCGIFLGSSSSYGSVYGNNVTANNGYGILLDSSSYNTVSGNNVANNYDGIWLGASSNNSIFGNNIIANNRGVHLMVSPHNEFYHNNFINNTQQVSSQNLTNAWDDGSMGNYWSDYQTKYPTATPVGNIWDTPYVIDANNTDHYPLVNQYVIPEFPSFLIVPLFMPTTLLTMVLYRKKHKTD
jgi:parallel beta-helix repeat protein